MRFLGITTLALATTVLANNALFTGYGSQCQSCLDAIVSKCSDGTTSADNVALCFCGNSEFLRNARACGTGVCQSENASTASKVASDLLASCCKTYYFSGQPQCNSNIPVALPGNVASPPAQPAVLPPSPSPQTPKPAQGQSPANPDPPPPSSASPTTGNIPGTTPGVNNNPAAATTGTGTAAAAAPNAQSSAAQAAASSAASVHSNAISAVSSAVSSATTAHSSSASATKASATSTSSAAAGVVCVAESSIFWTVVLSLFALF